MYKIKYIFLCSLLLINTFNIHAKPKAKNEIVLQEIDIEENPSETVKNVTDLQDIAIEGNPSEKAQNVINLQEIDIEEKPSETAKNVIDRQDIDIETIKQLTKETQESYKTFTNNYQLFKIKNEESLKFNMSISRSSKLQKHNTKEADDAREITFKNIQNILMLLEKSFHITHESLNIIVKKSKIKSLDINLESFEKVRQDLTKAKEFLKEKMIDNQKIYRDLSNELRNYDHNLRDQGFKNITTFPEYQALVEKVKTARDNLKETIKLSNQELSQRLFQYPVVMSNQIFAIIDQEIPKQSNAHFNEELNKESKHLKELLQDIDHFNNLFHQEEFIEFVQNVQMNYQEILIDF